MSSIAIIKKYYEAFNAKNWEVMLGLLDENVRHDSNQGNSNYGLDHFRSFLKHMDECYDEELRDLTYLASEDGSRLAAEFTVHGTYKNTDGDLPAANGQTYVLPAGAFLEQKGGKITRVTTYYNLEDWLKQVGA
ncbi:ketosteroid isomerase-related protein [Jiulongibacter sediminis]|uniref:Isopropylmalate/homocitrate/citramalate synthase n=1 Tax=Jiulongibacter sediminis TaxID=1605367 RepID=A0A0N8HA32_9BACT|nr:ketosteroid isomerase-related protein [Jiulongibacter sediminis]KPM49044.1 isopropylmalate/homocitrate/citramalate synthase [Jiulongibacter sediminis]TBX25559.1 isopropylmalate/homocitrate/citramalate synthase [Jiulongibacter sediminis]